MTTLGIDATDWIAGRDIKATGYDFVGRYCLSGAYRITPDEVMDYHANDLGIEFFGEHEADFMLGGGPRGTESGNDARKFLTSLGAPTGTVVFFTVDFDAQPSQVPALGAFMSAASIAIAPYRAGIYGGLIIGESFGSAWPYHQTEAWSHGEISPHANFYQRVGTTLPPIPNAGSYDEDIAINPIGLWLPPGSPTEDDTMKIYIMSDTPGGPKPAFRVWDPGPGPLKREIPLGELERLSGENFLEMVLTDKGQPYQAKPGFLDSVPNG